MSRTWKARGRAVKARRLERCEDFKKARRAQTRALKEVFDALSTAVNVSVERVNEHGAALYARVV